MEEEGRAQEKGKGSGWREGDRGGGERWETVIDTGGWERGEIPPSRHFPPFLWPQHCICNV